MSTSGTGTIGRPKDPKRAGPHERITPCETDKGNVKTSKLAPPSILKHMALSDETTGTAEALGTSEAVNTIWWTFGKLHPVCWY